jgi:DNA-directed RNA polymerase sigma subunit (sigma70/sigma32)
MNLSKCNGRVPVYTTIGDTPYRLVDFPSKEVFSELFYRSPEMNRAIYWQMMKSRAEGLTLADSGRPFGYTRERVRQIEAKFLRLMTELCYSEVSA